MSHLGVWLSPLLLLPATALLILSASARFGRIHEEIHYLLESGLSVGPVVRARLLRRSALLRNALISLYLSVSLLALAALLGAVTSSRPAVSLGVLKALTCLGAFALVVGTLVLVREAMLSLEILKEQFATVDWSEGGPGGGV